MITIYLKDLLTTIKPVTTRQLTNNPTAASSDVSLLSIAFIILISFLVILSGCSSNRFVDIYRMDIRQGNYIAEEAMARLRIGMTKMEVQELFGTPAIMHVLNKDRWDYYYYFKPNRGQEEERRLSVYFVNDRVVRWE